MSERLRLATLLGMEHWDDELLAHFALEHIAGLRIEVANLRNVLSNVSVNCLPDRQRVMVRQTLARSTNT